MGSRPRVLVTSFEIVFVFTLLLNNAACINRNIDNFGALDGKLEGVWQFTGGPLSSQEGSSGFQAPKRIEVLFVDDHVQDLRRAAVLSLDSEATDVVLEFVFSSSDSTYPGIKVVTLPSSISLDEKDRLMAMTMTLLVDESGLLPDVLFLDLCGD